MNWSLLQSGIGIDIQAGNLEAICVKRQWKRIRVADRLEIPQYRKQEPEHCGKLYRDFLRKNGLKVPWTVVALPRSAVLLRWLRFPRAVEKDLAHAVEYQLESLHPFEEGSVYWDFVSWKARSNRWGDWIRPTEGSGETGADRIDVAVAIADKKFVEESASWFQQASIGISQFTVTTAALLAALSPRLPLRPEITSRASQAFFFLNVGAELVEVAGYATGGASASRTVSMVSKEIPIASKVVRPGLTSAKEDHPIAGGIADSNHALLSMVERELELARSELRLDPEDRPPVVLCGKNLALLRIREQETENREEAIENVEEDISDRATKELFPVPNSLFSSAFEVFPVDHLFPSLSVGAESFRLEEDMIAFSAALTAADRTLPFSLNLLPAEKRSYQSPLVYLPAYALSALIVLLAVALGLRGTFQDLRYNRYLEQEIESLRPQLQAVEAAQAQSRRDYERLAVLVGLRNTAKMPLEVLDELTRIIPEDAWIQTMTYDGDTVNLVGYAKSASPLLQTLALSSYFENPQFLGTLGRTPDGKEVFRIGLRIRKVK